MDVNNSGMKFEFESVSYSVKAITYGQKARLSRWLKDEAYAELRAMRDTIDSEDYKQLLSQFLRDCAAGVYDFDGAAGIKMLEQPKGMRELIKLTVGMSDEAIERLGKDEASARTLGELMAAVNSADPSKATSP